MNKRRILPIVLMIGMLLSLAAFATSCTTEEETITVSVRIVGLDNDILCGTEDGGNEVIVTGKDLTVKDALEQAGKDIGLTVRYSSDGNKPIQIGEYIDREFTGVAVSDDEDDEEDDEDIDGEAEEVDEENHEDELWYWEYTLNGAEAAGSSVQKISEGDVIVWNWKKFEMSN